MTNSNNTCISNYCVPQHQQDGSLHHVKVNQHDAYRLLLLGCGYILSLRAGIGALTWHTE